VLDTAGSGEVSDDGDRDAHDRRRDRIFTMETVVVILTAVVGVVAFVMFPATVSTVDWWTCMPVAAMFSESIMGVSR
jgi:hypothetical protein